MVYSQQLPLTPTLSRKRERGRAERVIGAAETRAAVVGSALLPLAGEGGAKRRMRVCLSVNRLSANSPDPV